MTSDASLSPNPLRLLMELQQVSRIAQSFSGCLDPAIIAKQVTDQLVTEFNCAFARIWLVEPDQSALRLVASSGLYTHIDGSFARVPMGAFKVGKIAQNRIPFLSNHLAEESWVKDAQWAREQQITGFAGYPLAAGDRVVGVLAVFSRYPLSPEFLEVLQSLCTTVTVALDSATAHQQQSKIVAPNHLPLSEQVAALLPQARFVLVGTERSLSTSLHYLLLRTGEILSSLHCNQCRLMYELDYLILEAIVISDSLLDIQRIEAAFKELHMALVCLNGTLQTAVGAGPKMIQVSLSIPYGIKPMESGSLSEREQEILLLLAQGLRDRDIAQHLHISERTVKFHVNNAMVKLQAQTRCQAIYQAMQQGWLHQQ